MRGFLTGSGGGDGVWRRDAVNLGRLVVGSTGTELLNRAVENFGRENITAMRGAWTYGDNLAAINTFTQRGASLGDAVWGTFTGQRAWSMGFREFEFVSEPVIDQATGLYTNVQVLFR